MASEPLLIARFASLPFEWVDGLSDSGAAIEPVLAMSDRVDEAGAALEDALYSAAGPPEVDDARGGPGTRVATVDTCSRTALLQARRAVHNRRRASVAAAAGSIAAQSAALASRLVEFSSRLEALEAATAGDRARHTEALRRTSQWLLAAGREPVVAEAVRLVSRSLSEKAERLDGLSYDRWRHRERHTALKLAAYVARAASKTSPNGALCSTALGGFGLTAVCRGENAIVSHDVLLAVGEARKIAACLAVDPEFAPLVIPRPNPTLGEQDGHWTFWRAATPRQASDDDVRARARVHPVARAMLELCAPDRSLPELVAEASRRTGISTAELDAFAGKMIESGLLIGEVEIPWSERRPLRRLAEAARHAGCGGCWTERVEFLERAVDDAAGTPWPQRGRVLDRIAEAAEALPHRRALRHDELIRVDAASALDVRLPHVVVGELERVMEWYARFYSAIYPRQRFIDAYARRFLARYPADTEVDVLDLYHGVFEPAGVPRPAVFPAPSGSGALADHAREAFTQVCDRLAREARRAERDGRDEVALDALDWTPVLGGEPAPAWSCGVLFQVAADDTRAIDDGRFLLPLNGLYAGGGLAVARLAHLHAGGGAAEDGPIAREIRRSWSWLEREDAVVAEVSYMHAGRTANAGLRPSLFRHEIELPGDRTTPGRESIPLADLTVRFDSRARRFRLRSRRRGVDVMPIVTSGISPEGLVTFLLMIGQQDLQPLALFPGFDVEGIRRWPRFRFGRVVVFRRRWIFAPEETPFSAMAGPLEHRRMLDVGRWRRRQALPRRVFAHTDADPKPFYVDLESPWLVELLARRLAESSWTTLSLVEMLPGPGDLWVRDSRGRHASEFLVHLRNLPASTAGAHE